MDRRHSLASGADLPDRVEGAALFADVSGFVALTEALISALGRERGAEAVAAQLNRVFGRLIPRVHRYGGSVVGFHGDALTCWFDGAVFSSGTPASLRAIACALSMQQVMERFAKFSPAPGVSVSLGIKVSVAAGPARRFLVGDPSLQVIEVLAGETLSQVAAGERAARRGDVIVNASGVRAGEGAVRVSRWRTTAVGDFATVAKLEAEVPPVRWEGIPPEAQARIEAAARSWVLPAVYERLKRRQARFLAEHRVTVALFLRFTDLDYDGDDDAGRKLDRYIRWAQTVFAERGGALLHITLGDKGSYINGTFGAPAASENDSAAALAAAQRLRAVPSELEFIRETHMGVACGHMYTGASGSPDRRVYVATGNKANLAARIMQVAPAGEVWCDEEVRRRAESHWRFQSLPPVEVRGREGAVSVFRPVSKRADSPEEAVSSVRADRAESDGPLVGRELEFARLTAVLEGHSSEPVSLVIVEGEAGIGKSRLVRALREHAATHGVICLVGAGDSMERATAYHVWRPVFSEILRTHTLGDESHPALSKSATIARERRECVQAWVGEVLPEFEGLTPLLNDIFQLDVPESDDTRRLKGEVRAQNTRRLLTELFAAAATTRPIVLLEDAQWFDSSSWELLVSLRRRVPTAPFVVATRPIQEAFPEEFRRLAQAPDTEVLSLASLPSDAVRGIVEARLEVDHVPEVVVRLIEEKAGGNPLFAEEVACSLREAGLIEVSGGRCRLVAREVVLTRLDLPDTIQGVITRRVDCLPPDQQLILKAASVIGSRFTVQMLRDIHPVEESGGQLREHLRVLSGLGVIRVDPRKRSAAYRFNHAITREACYRLMALSQRRELHRAVALCLERDRADDIASVYPLLAHHWRNAEAKKKAIFYMDKAGTQSLGSSSYREAVEFFTGILDLLGPREDRVPARPASDESPPRLTTWTLQLAEAYRGWGHFHESRDAVARVASLYGRPLPATKGRLALRLLREVLTQFHHRLREKQSVGSAPAALRGRLLQEAKLYILLSELAYFGNQHLLSLYAAIRALNLNEVVGESVQLAGAYGAMGLLAGVVGLKGLSARYFDRGLRISRGLADPPVLADVLRLSSLYHISMGQWDLGCAAAQEALAIHERLQDSRNWGDCVMLLAHVALLKGDFATSERYCSELSAAAERNGNLVHQAWSLTWRAENLIRLGRLDEAIEYLSRAGDLLVEEQEVHAELTRGAYLAVAQWRRGDRDEAHISSTGVMKRFFELAAPPSAYHIVDAYNALAEVSLNVWEEGGSGGAVSPARRRSAQLACIMLSGYSRRFPIGEPSAWLHQGRYEWLSGRKRRARRAWKKSLDAAARLGMHYERGRAHCELSRSYAASSSNRRRHFERASEIFERLGTPYDAARLTGADAFD